MHLKSFLTKLFKGYEVLEIVDSPMNGEIKVVDDLFGGKSMVIGGVSQSGYLVEKLWKIAIKQIFNFQNPIFNEFSKSNFQCLILGLGCGNAAKLISQNWPEAKITGVEIDPKVIEIGEKYFGLDRIKNLRIVVGDAIEEIKNKKLKIKNTKKKLINADEEKFNLILIDLYLGREYPKEVESEVFIDGVKKMLRKDGIVIFNRLSFGEYKKGAEKFAEDLKKYFPKVWTKKAITNLLIFCQER